MLESLPNANRDAGGLQPRLPVLVLLTGIVLAFRIAAWLYPSSFIDIPESLTLYVGGLGIVFLVCGVWAWRSNPSPVTRVFLVVGLGGAIHWGGSIAAESSNIDIAFLVFYAAATAMGDAAFLDLSLRYPRTRRPASFPAIGFYVVAILTFVAVPIAPFVSKQVVQTALGFVFGVGFLMSIAGGVVFLVSWVRAAQTERREYSLTLIIVALVVPTVLDLAADAGALPGDPAAWTLAYVLEPVALGWALTRRRPAA